LSAFAPGERALFLRLLDKLTRKLGDSTRVPLEGQPAGGRRGRGSRGPDRVRTAATIKR
jgi:hypothetical protein